MSTVQFCNRSWSSCRLVVHELCSSSAKSEQKLFTVDGILLTNSVNSNISNTEPLGTPLVTGVHAEFTITFDFYQLGML